MQKSLEFFIAARYLRARRSSHFASFISTASKVGIAIGVAALIIVTSVMNGFGNDLRQRLVSLSSHITISEANDQFADWARIVEVARSHERVEGAAPFVEGQGMLVNGSNLSGVAIQGVAPVLERSVSELPGSMLYGEIESLQSGKNNILLGAYLAERLGASIGSQVDILVPQPTADGTSVLPFLHRFTVVGLFRGNVPEQSVNTAYVHIDDAARMFELGQNVSGVRLKLIDLLEATDVSATLSETLGHQYSLVDWSQQQKVFFRAIKIEKIMVFCILLLVVAVAAFNIVMTQVMLVNEKRVDVAILRTIGIRPRGILNIFLLQGNLIGLIGVGLGVFFGVLIGANTAKITSTIEKVLNLNFIDSNVFYLTQIPSDVRWHEVLIIALIGFALSVLSTVYPAWRASKTQPAEALRYD